MVSNFIINLFGTGIRYWTCEIPKCKFEEMEKIKDQHNVEWEHLLFDFDFLNRFGYNHWDEMSKYPEQVGFLLNKENRIEVKLKSKLITRFFAQELMNQETLFPLYQTSFTDLNFVTDPTKTSFLLLQFEKGLIGKFKFEAEHFSIDQVHYVLSRIGNNTFLSQIQLGEQFLESSQEDCVVVGSFFRC